MPSLRGVLFDVGGTLVADQFTISEAAFQERCVQRLTAAFGSERPWFAPLVAHEFAGSGVDPETLRQDVTGAVTAFLTTLGVSVTPAEVAGICPACAVPMPQLVTLMPGAAAAIRDARSRGLRLAICSNTFWRDDAAAAEDWHAFGLGDCFDAYITSPTTRFAKPHRAMFQRALASIGAAASEAAMVGDRLKEDISGGQAAGLRTIWLRPAEAPDPDTSGPIPDAIIGSLAELAAVLVR